MRHFWRLVLVLFVALVLAGPLPALAQLAPGGSAVVQADGDGLILREGPGYDAAAIDLIPDGTIVGIMDGPFYAEDGSVWYYVSASSDVYGYVVSDWLVERVFSDPGPGQTGSAALTYLPSEWCGADETWMRDSLYRMNESFQVWAEFGGFLNDGGWGAEIGPWGTYFRDLADAQAASVAPPAGVELQDSLTALLNRRANMALEIGLLGLTAVQFGNDYDESAGFARRTADLGPYRDEVAGDLGTFLNDCTT